MRFTYRLVQDRSGWVAECCESEAMGEGPTERAAVDSLRVALEERMLRPDAVAPPSRETHAVIELELAQGDHPLPSPSGPGDARPPR